MNKIEFLPNTEALGIGFSKCMIIGGYVVLDPKNFALVVDLDPKIRCYSRLISSNTEKTIVHVSTIGKKPNSEENMFKYDFTFYEENWKAENIQKQFEKFILAVLNAFFTYYNISKPVELDLNIVADPEFYTQGGKTGLGSSSATIISIMMSLMKLSQQISEEITPEQQDLLFQLASVANSIAQKKVGSGFDLSCAIWGPQIFRRPESSLISTENIGKDWGNTHTKFHLPDWMRLYLIKSGEGSSTADLVRSFNSHKSDPKDTPLYEELIKANTLACDALQSGDIEQIKIKFAELRNIQARITDEWKVPILPMEIRELISKFEKIPNYITAIPPGAGGYDAIAVITKGKTEIPEEFTVIAEKQI